MTVDKLRKIFDDAYAKHDKSGHPATESGCRSAGIRAVVEALRDEYTSSGYRMMTSHHFDEILDSDAGEKVAGGSTREDEQSCNSSDGSSPATDAAPAVCEWKKSQLRLYEHSPAIFYRTGCGADFFYNYKQCQGCGKPIAFTEANHG